jgi:type 1 glutamine amidotransferase
MKTIALVSLLAAALTATAAPKKILVITQSKGFVHGSVKRPAPDQLCLVEQTLIELGAKSGDFETVNSQNAIESITRENLAKFDGVFFYTTGILLPDGDPREALMDFVKSGKAFIGAHSATDTFHDGKDAYKPYVQMVNGAFNGHPWGSGTTCTFVNHDPAHPTVKMLGEEFQWKDEIYQYKQYDPASVRVLYSLNMAKTSPKMPYLVPVCWVREVGQGRLFYTNLGHNEGTWKNEKFHEHIIAGFRWALKLDNGSAVPNPEVQQQQHDKSVVAYAADVVKKDYAALLPKAKNPAWLAAVSAAADALRKAPNVDAKKAKPEEVEAARAKKDELKAKLVAAVGE